MENYCKAIEEAKLPAKPSKSGPRDGRFSDKNLFLEFVNSDIDLRDMSQNMADFTQSGDVAQALHAIRNSLQLGIQQRLTYAGSLHQIGSFYDGSKTGRLNEMDCLYVVSEADVMIRQANPDTGGDFRVYVKGTEIKPRAINERLLAAMQQVLSDMTLPDGWTHGGYRSPDFSGARCNGPSVTAMFSNNDEKHISLDVSIAFPLIWQVQQRADFPSDLRDSCRCLADSINKIQSELTRTQISADLHLIGNVGDDTWQPTTALAEANILRALVPECPVKRALEICKSVTSKIQKWYKERYVRPKNPLKGDDDVVPAKRIRLSPRHALRESILADIYRYSEPTTSDKAEALQRLNKDMPYQHIHLSASDRIKFREVLKSDASINTAANQAHHSEDRPPFKWCFFQIKQAA